MTHQTHTPAPGHPVLGCAASVRAAVKDVADVNPGFMTTADKKTALLELGHAVDQLEELWLRVLASADDVAAEEGMRDPAAWPITAAGTAVSAAAG